MQTINSISRHQLVDSETGEVLIQSLQVADSVWSRFRGWMLRKNLPPSSGILIHPCASVHTMWMRVTIDLAFLSKDNSVLGTRKSVRPWRIAIAPKGTASVLETLEGQSDFVIGTKLRVEEGKRS